MPKLPWFRKRMTASVCGHKTFVKGSVTAFGQTTRTVMPLKDGRPEYCLDCITDMAVQCAWCTLPIFIGDAVTLYSPREIEYEVPSFAVVYSEVPPRLVGCLRWDCAQTGADRAGVWLPNSIGKGHVKRMPTVFEQMFGAKVGGSLKLVASSDPSQQESTRQMVFPIEKDDRGDH